MAKILGKKVKKNKARVEKQIAQAVKASLKKERFLAIGMGMMGTSYLLYVFGPGITGEERRTAVSKISEMLVKYWDKLEIMYVKEFSEYPFVDIPSQWSSLYEPHRVVREMLGKSTDEPRGFSLKLIKDSLTISPERLRAALDQLHRYQIIRLTPLGHVWFKTDLEKFVEDDPELDRVVYVVPSEVM